MTKKIITPNKYWVTLVAVSDDMSIVRISEKYGITLRLVAKSMPAMLAISPIVESFGCGELCENHRPTNAAMTIVEAKIF